jgi:Ca-activated chloride channel family protein
MMQALPDLSFLWPRMLWLCCLPLLLAGLYLWRESRRRRAAALYPAFSLTGLSAGAKRGWSAWLPPSLFLLSLAALTVAIARPQATLRLPARVQTVILALDMSGSMQADDVKPDRFNTALRLARELLADQPATVSVGVVAVAGAASVALAPSRAKDEVAQALDRLQPQRGSALGSGIIISLTTLLPGAGIDARRLLAGGNKPPAQPQPKPKTEPVEPGSYASGAIVLFSDGENNTGLDTLAAAQVAADHGVRVYTVGVGTPEGAVLKLEGWSARVKLRDEALKKVAEMTGGEYFAASEAGSLNKIYRALSARLTLDKLQLVEITALLAALGALLAAGAGMLSLWRHARVL